MHCGHCGTEALLPAPLVHQRFAQLHRRVVAARGLVRAKLAAEVGSGPTWQRVGVPRVVGLVATSMASVAAVFVFAATST